MPDVEPGGLADVCRRLRLHDLLLWQADRAFNDHWYSENGKDPYYKLLTDANVKDAHDLAKSKADEEINRGRTLFDAKVKTATGLAIPESLLQHMTTESQFKLDWPVTSSGVPPGVPMRWLKVGEPLAAPTGIKLAARTPIDTWPPSTVTYS